MHDGITVTDMRRLALTLADFGFQVLQHASGHLELGTREKCRRYQRETEEVLGELLRAVFVKCYEVRKRENVRIVRDVMYCNDPLLVERPVKGAHNGRLLVFSVFVLLFGGGGEGGLEAEVEGHPARRSSIATCPTRKRRSSGSLATAFAS